MASESADSIERWKAKMANDLVASLLKSDPTVAEAARKHGLTLAEVEDWREKFLQGGRERTAASAMG